MPSWAFACGQKLIRNVFPPQPVVPFCYVAPSSSQKCSVGQSKRQPCAVWSAPQIPCQCSPAFAGTCIKSTFISSSASRSPECWKPNLSDEARRRTGSLQTKSWSPFLPGGDHKLHNDLTCKDLKGSFIRFFLKAYFSLLLQHATNQSETEATHDSC